MKTIKDEKRISNYRRQLNELAIIPDELINKAHILETSKEERLIYKGDTGTLFCFLISGSILVQDILPDGSILTISKTQAPCMIGEMELIDPSFETMQVFLQAHSIVFVWNLKDVENTLLNNNHFLRYLAYTIAHKERSSNRMLAKERSMSGKERLASFILDNSFNNVFSLRKTVTAERLGISYRHTEKLFYDLIEEKVIKKEGLRYIITDIKALKSICELN